MSKPKQVDNVLSKVIPGYTAPLKLKSNLPTSDLATIRARAARTEDISTASAGMHSKSQREHASLMLQNRILNPSSTDIERKVATMGEGWFNMRPSELDDQLKTDLKVLDMRNILDPKRFYKSSDKIKNKKRMVQVGTVLGGMAERAMTKRQRKSNLTEEIMADSAVVEYTKKTASTIEQKKATRFYPSKQRHRGKR